VPDYLANVTIQTAPRRLLSASAWLAEEGVDPTQQRIDVVRSREDSVDAEIQKLPEPVILLALGEDDDLATRAMRAQGAKERDALKVGQARVENNEVGPGCHQPVETFGSGRGRGDDEAVSERNGKGGLHPENAPDHENPGSSIGFHRRAPVIVPGARAGRAESDG
jgi:hypothetical protein